MNNKKSKEIKPPLEVPEFSSEMEEALWWENNQAAVLKEFKRAAKDGTLQQGTLAKQGLTAPVTIRLDAADIELARTQAQARGLRYQTYVKMVLHQALVKEETATP